ncbi:hypothetical protein C1C98_24215 [Pseudomonas ogarae]|uniref:Uncharacterized protein n=1 Tax=Pseudomonas ogarae (strain DSM 112162 / CECT 30235 / F113) TaxID=1114970 RepID=A0ABM6R4K4_PSEO1|nr:hypothetical protein C1C98_24215 [Pseudomonas ogarae]
MREPDLWNWSVGARLARDGIASVHQLHRGDCIAGKPCSHRPCSQSYCFHRICVWPETTNPALGRVCCISGWLTWQQPPQPVHAGHCACS